MSQYQVMTPHIAQAGQTVNPNGSEANPKPVSHHPADISSGGGFEPVNTTDLSQVQGVIPQGGRTGEFHNAIGKAKEAWQNRKGAGSEGAEGAEGAEAGAEAGEAAGGLGELAELALL